MGFCKMKTDGKILNPFLIISFFYYHIPFFYILIIFLSTFP